MQVMFGFCPISPHVRICTSVEEIRSTPLQQHAVQTRILTWFLESPEIPKAVSHR